MKLTSEVLAEVQTYLQNIQHTLSNAELNRNVKGVTVAIHLSALQSHMDNAIGRTKELQVAVKSSDIVS